MTNDKSNEKKNIKDRPGTDIFKTMAAKEAAAKFGTTESYVYRILRKGDVTNGKAEDIRRFANERQEFYRKASESAIQNPPT